MEHTVGAPKPFRDPSSDAAVIVVNWLKHALIESFREVYIIDTRHVLRLSEEVAKALYARGGGRDVEPEETSELTEEQLLTDITDIVSHAERWSEERLAERIRIVSEGLAKRHYRKVA